MYQKYFTATKACTDKISKLKYITQLLYWSFLVPTIVDLVVNLGFFPL